jgi:hypothetical protein
VSGQTEMGRVRLAEKLTSSRTDISRLLQTLPPLSIIKACQKVSILYRVSASSLGGGRMDERYSSEELEPTGVMWLRPHDIAKRSATVNAGNEVRCNMA